MICSGIGSRRARFVAAAAAALLLTAQAPSPQPTSLPLIGRTHSKGFCTTVRDNVAPALLGVMKTDDLIGAGHRAALKTAHDATSAPEAQEFDRVYVERVVAAMAHNLGVIKKVLADEKRFPKVPATDDDRYALLLKAQLQATSDRQAVALDHLNGVLETEGMHTMRSDISTGMQQAIAMPAVGNGFFDSSALPGAGPGGLGSTHVVQPSNTLGNTIWDKLAADIEVQQAKIVAVERVLSPIVIAAAISCRGEESPKPNPTP
jgi:hypothetical protein